MAAKEKRATKQKAAETRDTDTGFKRNNRLIYIGSVIILVIVVVTFIGAPVATGFVGGSRLVFGRYDNRDIVYTPGNYFARRYQQIAEQTEISGNDAEFRFQLRTIWRRAFNDTVFHTAVLVEAERAGMVPSQGLVDRTLAQHPAFQEDGRFSSQRYQQMPQQERQSLRSYLEEIIIQQRFIQDRLQGMQTPDSETTFVSSMSGPERRFQYAAFSFTEVPDDLVRQYADENLFRFQQAQLSRITIRSSAADAERIRTQLIDRTASFEDLAQAHSVDAYASQGGDMGWTHYYELEPDFLDPTNLDQVYSLGVGEVSPVLPARDTWMIYRMNEPVRQLDLGSDDAIATVRRYMSAFERGRIEDFLLEQARQFRSDAVERGFTQAAADHGLEIRQSGFFPVNYGNVPIFSPVRGQNGNLLEAGAFREDFFRELFSLEMSEISQPVTLQSGTIVAVPIEERDQSGNDIEFLRSYYPYLVQQIQAEELERGFIDSSRLTDNFNQAFARYVLGN
jgi:peptidyl-prolyl cis-trans isomerase D